LTNENVAVNEIIGKSKVHVPTHLFKVFIVASSSSQSLVSAFVVENLDVSIQRNLSEFEVSLDEFERLAGFSLLVNMPRSAIIKLCGNVFDCNNGFRRKNGRVDSILSNIKDMIPS
jgi:DNA/RNA endonuclease G (NUC1)